MRALEGDALDLREGPSGTRLGDVPSRASPSGTRSKVVWRVSGGPPFRVSSREDSQTAKNKRVGLLFMEHALPSASNVPLPSFIILLKLPGALWCHHNPIPSSSISACVKVLGSRRWCR